VNFKLKTKNIFLFFRTRSYYRYSYQIIIIIITTNVIGVYSNGRDNNGTAKTFNRYRNEYRKIEKKKNEIMNRSNSLRRECLPSAKRCNYYSARTSGVHKVHTTMSYARARELFNSPYLCVNLDLYGSSPEIGDH